jgi:protein-tyrosine phosphatase
MRAPESHQRPLEGVPNFRDLGGLPTADGGRTRRGVLFRSSGLEELTEADVGYLVDRIGLRTVIDLRSPDDIETPPLLIGTPIRLVNHPIVRRGSSTSLERPMRPDGRVDVPLVYRMFMETSIPSIAAIFDELVTGGTPAVIHCAAGKDRTGVIAALILGAIGVTRSAIIDDFMASEPVLDDVIAYLQRRPAYSDIIHEFPPGTMDAEPEFIGDFLDGIDAAHGNIPTWLVTTAGIPIDTIERLRRLFVEGSDP